MDDRELDDRLRKAVSSLADAAPEPRPFPGRLLASDADRSSVGGNGLRDPRAGRWLLIAAAVIVAAGLGVAVWAATTDGESIATNGGVLVLHELVAYEQSFEAACPEGEVAVSGEFETMVFESWGSQDLGRWRQVVRYPDGSQRELVATENPWIPTELFIGGTASGLQISCPGLGILLQEPGQNAWFGLNPMADLPTRAEGEEPMVPLYSDLGELVDDAATGPDGRVVERWRQVVDGSYDSGSGETPLRQVQEWLVDPTTGQVVQLTFSQVYEGVGEIHWTADLTAFDSITIDADLFNSDGLAPVSE